MKIIAIDFDGTIVHSRFPEIGPPIPGAIDVIKTLMGATGVKLILWTIRDGEYLKDAVEWCKSKGLRFDTINKSIDIFSASPKVYAHRYIDDRSINIPMIFDEISILDWDAIGQELFEWLGLK